MHDTALPAGDRSVNRRRRVLPIAISLVVIACAPSAGGPGRNTATTPAYTGPDMAEPTTAPNGAMSPSPLPAATVHGDVLTLDASIGYSGLREWTRIWGGIALVEITDVGAVRWDTEAGSRPDEALIHSAPAGHGDAPGIGRLIEVRRIRILSGRWLGPSDLARYWRPGGRIGADEMIDDLDLPTLASGAQAVAFLLPQPGNVASEGSLPVEVGWIFPIDTTGRVVTLDPDEEVTLEDLESFLP